MALDKEDRVVKVGDTVSFKCDHDQSGEVKEIDNAGLLTIFHIDGFGGSYLKYSNFAYEYSDRVLLEKSCSVS
jgi:hypothetical protein